MRHLDRGLRIVLVWTISVAFLIGIFTVIRWNDWNYGFDLGIFSQVVSNVPRAFVDQPEFGTHFHFHFAPILALLWPFMAIFQSPLVLQWAAIVLILATTPVLYVLFRPYMDERTSIWISLCCLFNPFLYSQSFNEFHELCFLPVLALLLLWALDRQRWILASIFALLVFCVREDAAITGIFSLTVITLVAYLQKRHPSSQPQGLLLGEPQHPARLMRVTLSLAVVGVVVISTYFLYARNYLGGWEPASFYQYSFASTPFGVVMALFLQPSQSWPALLTLGRIGYFLEAMACMAFLPFRSRWILLAIPGFAVVLLANSIGVWRIGAQYALLWVPWLFIAFGAATIHLSARSKSRWLLACGAILAIISLVGNPLHLGTYLRPSYHDLVDAKAALAYVGNAPLSTHDEWQTQVSVKNPQANSELSPTSLWFIYADDYPNDRFQHIIKPELREMVRRGTIRIVARFGSVVVYKRRG